MTINEIKVAWNVWCIANTTALESHAAKLNHLIATGRKSAAESLLAQAIADATGCHIVDALTIAAV